MIPFDDVKQLIQMHGGTVTAESAGLGCGATFTIHLPTVSAPSAAHSKDVHYTAPRRRILVVDDNEDAAKSLAMLLEFEGQEAFTAFSGPDALSAAEQLRPEVVVLDIGLPKMDGYEVARRLRSQYVGACPRLIALTGYGQPEDRNRALAAGFAGHLTKPIDQQQLQRMLSEDLNAAAEA